MQCSRGKSNQMKQRLELELDVITDLSPLELASKVAPLVQEAIEKVKQSLGTEYVLFIILKFFKLLIQECQRNPQFPHIP